MVRPAPGGGSNGGGSEVEAAGAGEGENNGNRDANPLDAEFAAIDAVLARSDAAIEQARAPSLAGARERDPLVYDPDWDEDERLEEWRGVLRQAQDLPAVLQSNRRPGCVERDLGAAACALARPAVLRLDPAPGRRHHRRASRRRQSRPEIHPRRSAPASQSRDPAARHRAGTGRGGRNRAEGA